MLKFHHSKDSIRNHKFENYLLLRRLLVIFSLMLLLIMLLLKSIYTLQVRDYTIYQTRSNSNRIKIVPTAPIRGIIYDRNNKILANSQLVLGLYVTPEKISNLDQTIKRLQKLVGVTDTEVEEFYRAIKNRTKYLPLILKANLSDEQRARFAINQHLFPYIEIRPYYTRIYPYAHISAHLIGYIAKLSQKDAEILKKNNQWQEYLGINNIGKSGIEQYYEEDLRGKQGFEKVEVNNKGRVIRTLFKSKPKTGTNIKLTIDIELQQYIYSLLGDVTGSVVVIDPRDAGILAMVSNPSYDNNLFVDGISHKDYNDLLNNPEHPLYNRAVQSLYPLASTAKPFLGIAALEEKIITADTILNAPGSWTLPRSKRKYRDFKAAGHGRIKLEQAIERSSDTFFYQVAYRLGINNIHKWMTTLGFGRKTGLDLNEGTPGFMPSPAWKEQRYNQKWVVGDTIPIGIGQGYWNTTPTHLAKALVTLINNGHVQTPHLLQLKQDSKIETYKAMFTEEKVQLSNPQHWKTVKKGMLNVTNSPRGTAFHIFRYSPFKAAGKTGTAQVFSLKGAKYNKNKLDKKLHDHALFIGYAPYDNPQLAVVVILEHAGFGGSHAAPVANKIFEYYLNKNNELVQ